MAAGLSFRRVLVIAPDVEADLSARVLREIGRSIERALLQRLATGEPRAASTFYAATMSGTPPRRPGTCITVNSA